ncbi:MAG: UDP-2,3-diacylglucosamine diphosphatase LpxI [Xanthobacteraceae bacterium]|jgi:UDP-2,3-diacylglucosamine hydrolase
MQPDAPTIADTPAQAGPLAIICGGGSLPGAVADVVARRGRRPVMFGIKGWADASVIGRYTHHWIAIGQAGRFFRLARDERCREILFIGTVLRPPITQLRLDWQTIKAMPGLIRAYRGGDDRLISGVARIAESGGLRVVGVKDVAPEVLVPEGSLGRHQPSERDWSDIERARHVIAALGPFDVGQAAVVADNNVLAVEAAEGTDNLLNRIAELRKLGRVTARPGTGVLVKAPKPGQDHRFDLPSIGPRTVENVARAGLAGLAVAAGSTMIAEADAVIAAADRAGIFIVGVGEGAGR